MSRFVSLKLHLMCIFAETSKIFLEFLKKFHSKCIHECKKSKKKQTVWRENAPKSSEQCFYVAAQRPYLTLAIDADIQQVSLASGAVDDCRRALCVEVVALCQAVQSAGLNATCFKENAHRRRRCLSPVWPAHRGTTTRRQQKGQDGDPGRLFYTKVKSECSGVKHSVLCCYSCCLSRVWTQLNRVVEASTSQKKEEEEEKILFPRFAFWVFYWYERLFSWLLR